MTTVDYWASLQFDYVTTYSMLRGAKWNRLLLAMRNEIVLCRKQLLTAKGAHLLEVRRRLESLHQKNNLQHALLTENGGTYHITASPVASLSCNSEEVRQLADILTQPFQSRMDWMCAPVFRDVLAFYDTSHQLVAVLNVCFQCDQIQNEKGLEIDVDTTVYPALRQWFLALGHAVEDGYVIE